MRPLAILALLAIAGCLDEAPPAEPDPEPDGPPLETSDVMVQVRAPRDIYSDVFAFRIVVEAPDGTTQEGTHGTDGVQALVETPTRPGCQGSTNGGDVRACEIGVSPYNYFLFDNVTWTGRWTLTIERTQDSSVQEELTGMPEDGDPPCLVFRLLEGGEWVPEDGGFAFATVTDDWWRTGVQTTVERGPEDDC